MAIRLLVGLGNPGPRYADTRHNAGAWLVEYLAERHGVALQPESRFFGRTGRLTLNGHDLRLLVPDTYMNESGKAVGALATFFKLAPETVLVAHDELDLPPGTARLKHGGGHGGHNGLRDVIRALGNSREFARARLGIGHPGQARDVTPYVLGKAPTDERILIDRAIDRVIDVLPDAVGDRWEHAQQALHTAAD